MSLATNQPCPSYRRSGRPSQSENRYASATGLPVACATMRMGQRIQRLLDQRCLSQSELARRVNLRQSTINALIHGKSRSSTHLHRIARELGTTAAYLTGETDDPGPNAAGEDERLSSQERRLIAIYRQLPKADRAALKRMVERMADEGKGSDDGHGT